jgi:hypothetical protein
MRRASRNDFREQILRRCHPELRLREDPGADPAQPLYLIQGISRESPPATDLPALQIEDFSMIY